MKQRSATSHSASELWARLGRRLPTAAAADTRVSSELSTIVERRLADGPQAGRMRDPRSEVTGMQVDGPIATVRIPVSSVPPAAAADAAAPAVPA